MHELLTASQMRDVDAAASAGGIPGRELMERAGRAVAAAALRLAPGGPIDLLCGPGNNGGDGFVAARLLAEAGADVRLFLLGPREAMRGDAAGAAQDWPGAALPIEAFDSSRPKLIVDALFGTGLARPLAGVAAACVEAANASAVPILAVDMPSGVDSDTGEARGPAARATETVTFARRKPGQLLDPGRVHCGRLTLVDIGIPGDILARSFGGLFANEPRLWLDRFPRPDGGIHKYGRGHALVLSGPATRTGAARLAARAALRVGAGLVTLGSPRSALLVNAAHLTAVMLQPCDDAGSLAAILGDRRINVVALGPALGVGERARDLVRTIAAAGRAAVLDADAVTSFAGGPAGLRDALQGAAGAVLTPHEGEFSRLFDGPDVAGSKLVRAQRAASFLEAVVVLKGPDTVIAAPDGRAAINAHASPYLATAGSGDVLAGFIAGLIAQGTPAFEAACAGVWLHGDAGLRLGPGLIAEDLPDAAPASLRALLGA